MNAQLQSTAAENTGARLGRAWRKLLRREKQFTDWLIRKGVPASIAKASVWIPKLTVLAIVLYFSLAAAVLIGALLIVAAVAAHADLSADPDKYDWRDGPQGHGMYNRIGDRIDPYDHTEQP